MGVSTHGTLVGPEVISYRGGERPPTLGPTGLGLDEDWGPQHQCPEHEREGRGPLPGLCPDAQGPARLPEDWSERVRLWGLPSPDPEIT